MAKRRNDLLLYGGAIVGLGILGVGVYIAYGAINPPTPAQISLSVQPSEVQEGSGFPITASGIYTLNGQPASGAIYMKYKSPSGGSFDLPQRFGPSFSNTIPTQGLPAGDYTVEASDDPRFI